jgi:hypothetical protein
MTGGRVDQKKRSNKKVLMITNSPVLGEDAILHGINLSNRMEASLEILHLITPEATEQTGKGFEKNTAQLSVNKQLTYTQLPEENGFTQEAIDYAKNRRNVLCVILCIKDEGGSGKYRKKIKDITKILSCPVILHTDSPA